jgi:hypothetical protein
MTPDVSHGKEFEKDCTAVFGHLYMQFFCRWERTLDSGAAGNIVRNADSDFRLLVKSEWSGRPYLFYVECKASKQGKPFENYFRSLVKPNQNASLHAARRGGAEAFVLYRDLVMDQIQVWRGRDVNEYYGHKRQPILASPAFQFMNSQLANFAVLAASKPAELLAALEDAPHKVRYL